MLNEILHEYLLVLDENEKSFAKNTLNLINNYKVVVKDDFEELIKIAQDEINADLMTILACVAHNCLDSNNLKQLIENKELNPEIKTILTGISSVPEFNLDKLKAQSENHIKLLVTLSQDVRAIMILLIEHLQKIRHLKQLDEKEALYIATKVNFLYSPVAHRIGLYKIKTEMEEVCLKYFDYPTYRSIADKLQIKKAERDKYIAEFIEPLKQKFLKNGLKFTIKGRPKSIASIKNKMKNQGVDVDGIYDLFAIRIILDSELKNEKSDCWKAYSLIVEEYKPNPYRLRDWISVPKASGYESLHTTVIGPLGRWVEVQIRTERMDEIAEKGLAAHWKYKNGTDGKNSGNIFSRIREAIENPETNKKDSNEKKSLYSDEIYIFTPDGDLIKMHAGDTILDFAFSIHSELGCKCIGAQLNNKFASIKQVLQNGDTVKLITNNNQKPSPEWVNIAHNQRVKNRIKRIVVGMQNRLSQIGKDILRQKLNQANLEFSDVMVNRLVKNFGFETAVDLYQALGDDKIDLPKLKKAIEDNRTEKTIAPPPAKSEKHVSENNDSGNGCLVIDNMSSLDYTMAQCCKPLPGDKIFAFVTVDKGTKIHSYSCPNAKSLLTRFPYRVVNAIWKNQENSPQNATILIEGIHSAAMSLVINNIIINEFHAYLRSFTINETDNGKFTATFSVNMDSMEHINALVGRLKHTKNIEKVVLK